MSDLVFDK